MSTVWGMTQSADDALRHIFEQHGRERSVGADQALFFEGDPSTSVYYVQSGLIRIETTTSDGRVVLLDLSGPGDTIGELGVVRSQRRSASAWTSHDSVLWEIAAHDFQELLGADARLAMAVLFRTADRLGEITFQLVEASAYTAASRTAARLVRLIEMAGVNANHPQPIDLAMPITQQQLAEWAGLTREGVVAGLAKLRSLGIITTGRMRVTVLDLDALRRVAFGGDR